jgi:hypothetical protein
MTNQHYRQQQFLGFTWLAAMLNTFFYLPAGLMFLMYYLLYEPLQQTMPIGILLFATVACLTVWSNSVVVLMSQDYLAKQSMRRIYLLTALPLLGLALAAAALLVVLVIFLSSGFI